MKIVYLSNSSIKGSTALSFDRDIPGQIDTIINTNEDRVYVIDVHLRSKNYQSLEDQGGLATYRYLIDKYTNAERKASYPLKVVFYSPLSALQLSHKKLKSQNYVLNILPFIQLKASKDFSFELKLAEFLSPEFIFPKFNTTSENLLAGWAYNGAKAFKFQDKKILFIDDESEEWKSTLDVILDGQYALLLDGDQKTCRSKFEYLFPLKKDDESDEEFENRESNLDEAIRNCIQGFDLIISDFYILENHQTNFIQDYNNLSDKSGAKLFKRIRELDPFIPFVFHTTSNKIQYFKFFDSLGVDNWVVKQPKHFASKYEKLLYYYDINESLSFILYGNKSEWYVFLREKYKQIINIENKEELWWKNGIQDIYRCQLNGSLYIALLKQNWSLLRQMINSEVHVEKSLVIQGQNMQYTLICAIISNLYKIIEDIKGKLSKGYEVDNSRLPILESFVTVIRNVASHITKTSQIQIEDAFMFFDLMIEFLSNSKVTTSGNLQYAILGNELKSDRFIEKIYFSILIPYLNFYVTLDECELKDKVKSRLQEGKLIANFNYTTPIYTLANIYYQELEDFNKDINTCLKFFDEYQIDSSQSDFYSYKNDVEVFNSKIKTMIEVHSLNKWKFYPLRIKSETDEEYNKKSNYKYIENHKAILESKKSQIEKLMNQFEYCEVNDKFVLNIKFEE